MTQPRTSWLATGAAALLIGGAGYWLGQVLPTAPRPPTTASPPAASAPAAELQPVPPPAPAPPALTAAAAPEPEPPCPPRPWAFVRLPAARRRLQVRRYVGTLGQQSITAELRWHHPDSIEARYYLRWGGPEVSLYASRTQPGQLVLRGCADCTDSLDVVEWRLSHPPGATLTGTWRHQGRPQPLALRESYAGAVRYTIETMLLRGGGLPIGDCEPAWQQRDFLMLLNPKAVPAALRPVLAPSLARRQERVWHKLEGDGKATYTDDVRLNGFGLLGYQTSIWSRAFGGTSDEGMEGHIFDLKAGKELTFASQLRPDYELPLRRLLTRHLLHDPEFDDINTGRSHSWAWQDEANKANALVPLPNPDSFGESLTLTAEGLEVTYDSFTLFGNGGRPTPVVVPYRELRPLVRPGTPLARMLQARGMW
ncbi:hypothetical protein Q5H93_23365 [Hymenobacter sp. ASUV-10]|uniref:DUF3298 domain-containing protein n=1 Tax=Hymenobacter aranciens TaxID=3063996 RepID=A0ABT9BHF0_9BACT|nr:hypothetical protein [Hymenobacter sp. ASUV-10]MDO7877695.1 hypothetical protein [Hymenobacter sp. ASUV-10]